MWPIKVKKGEKSCQKNQDPMNLKKKILQLKVLKKMKKSQKCIVETFQARIVTTYPMGNTMRRAVSHARTASLGQPSLHNSSEIQSSREPLSAPRSFVYMSIEVPFGSSEPAS